MADAAPAAPSGATPPPAQGAPTATPPAAQKPGETPAQAEARRLKLRLGNEEVELDESEVVANYQKGKNAAQIMSAAEKRRQEVLKEKAYADGILNRLKSDPRGVLKELGLDVRKMSEETILQEIELEKMSPAERRAHDAEQRIKALEAEKAKQEEERNQSVHAEEVKRHADEFANLFLETMQATGLPKESGRWVAYRMAHLYRQNEEAGLQSTPEEMASHVLQGMRKEHAGVLGGLKGKALAEHLGPEVVKEILRYNLEQVRARRGGGQPPPAAPAAPPPTQNLDPRKGRWAQIDKLIKGG